MIIIKMNLSMKLAAEFGAYQYGRIASVSWRPRSGYAQDILSMG